jgi:uncharacterized protein (UPF0333 family)
MKFANKKAQSAMEYLMTYGWAILIVIIVAAALYALGVFNPATFTGRTATGFQVLGAPTDWDLATAAGTIPGNLTLNLANNKMATAVTILNITATISGAASTYSPTGLVLGPGASGSRTFPTTSTLTTGSSYSVKLAIVYNAGGLDHTDTGTVTGVVS